MRSCAAWYKFDREDLPKNVLERVHGLEQTQELQRERWWKLACMYDPYLEFEGGYEDGPPALGQATENLIASNVDSVTSIASVTEVRPRFTTDGATWTEQRKAKGLAYYAEGLVKLFGIRDKCVEAFKQCAIKGTGLVKVWDDGGKLRIEHVMVDDIVVDERQTRSGGQISEIHHRVFVDKQVLIDRYAADNAELAAKIRAAQSHALDGINFYHWAGAYDLDESQVVMVESFHRSGRHTVVLDGVVLHDKTDDVSDGCWHPFAVVRWTTRCPGFYGIGGGERVAGHQRRLTKYNWQTDRIIDRHAMPTNWIHFADADIATVERNSLGYFGYYRVSPPQTVNPPALNPDMLMRTQDLREGGHREFGMSEMAATATKPAGLESGASLREWRDITTQRFALQERAHEQLVLDVVWLALRVCKRLGKKAPSVYSSLRRKRFEWSEVEMDVVRQQLQAANNLPTTPSGRRQLAVELSQAGMISTEEARRLLGPTDPIDVEAAMAPHLAAIDYADWQIESILDGATGVVPNPYSSLPLTAWRAQQALLRESMSDDAPEETLERLRGFVVMAIHLKRVASGEIDIMGQPLGLQDPGSMPPGPPMPGAGPVGVAPPQNAVPMPAMAPNQQSMAL